MDTVIKALEQKLRTLARALVEELGGIRTNRPTTKFVEDIRVPYAEQTFSVKQLGTIGVVPPRDIVITVWDKGAVPAIAKAIQDAKLGITPSTDGNVIRMQLPSLTAERREEFVRLAKSMVEKIRIRMRADRDETMKAIERMMHEKQVSEDQKFKLKKQAQEAVDKANKDTEEALQKKVREISE